MKKAQGSVVRRDGPVRHPPITVDVRRGALLESRHVVYGVVLRLDESDPNAALEGRSGLAWGEASFLTVMRSGLKPWQLLPLVVDGGADAFSLSDEELALAAASHSGQEEHIRVLDSFMQKVGVEESQLACPGHAPVETEAARAIGTGWGRRHDNCSGKHTGMIAWCRHAGLDATGYTSREHPVQERILGLVARLSGEDHAASSVAVDGCRVPTVGLKLASIARLFLLLGRPERLAQAGVDLGDEESAVQDALRRIAGAMAHNPLLVAGTGRVDTDVISATKGRLVTKVGAEGVWGGVDREKGVAFAFKAIDGGSRAVAPAALGALNEAGVFTPHELSALSSHLEPVVRDRAGDRVGRIVVDLPGSS